MASDLRTEAVRGAGWTAAQKWAIRVSSLLVFVVLSRLLGPEQIGMAAIALAVISLLSAPLELALRSFLVRSDGREARAENTAFWVAIGVSLVAVGISCGVAGVIWRLDGPQQLWQILIALSPMVLIAAVDAVPTARLEKDLQFRSLAIREMVSAVLAGVVGVAMAASGAGVWALVGQAQAQVLVSLLLVLKFTRWRPGFSFSKRCAHELVRFGGPLVGVQLVTAVRDRGDQVLIGSILGLDALGLWAIATRILAAVEDLSISLLDIVAYPVFVRMQEDRARLSRAFGIAVSTCQSLLVPILALVAVTAPALVPAVFGNQWTGAVLPTQVLCIGYAIYGLSYLNRPLLRSVGKTGTEFTFVTAVEVFHLGVIAIVASQGLTAIAIALVAESVISVLVGAWLLSTRVGIASPLPRPSLVTTLFGLLAAACGLAVAQVGDGTTLFHAALAGVLTLVVFGVGMGVFNRPVLTSLREDARRLIPRSV